MNTMIVKDWLDLVENSDVVNLELKACCDKISYHCQNDTSLVELIAKLYPGHFIWNDKKRQWYGWNGQRWENNEHPFKKCVMYDVEKYWNNELNSFLSEIDTPSDAKDEGTASYKLFKATKDKMTTYINKQLKNSAGISNKVSVAKSLIYDNGS